MARSHVRPPPSKASDEAVLAFLVKKKGAIGYVSASAEIPPGVKVLRVAD